MNSAISTALSGLNADSAAINILGNDLANLNTTGYKADEIDFDDLMSQSIGGFGSANEVGLGVSMPLAIPQYTQGAIQTTGGPTDAAIQGNGFFVVQGANNQTLYTRDGSFQINAEGQLVTATGQDVMGWNATNGVVNPNGAVSPLIVPLGGSVPAAATANLNLALNLDSNATSGSNPTTFSAPVQVYDSLGNSHTLTVAFTNTAANSWNYNVTIPAADLAQGGSTTVSSGSLTFGPDGTLTSPPSAGGPQVLSVTGLADGASDLSINWNLYNNNGNPTITQLAEPSAISSTTQDGNAPGQISNVSLQNGGLLVANYSNGQQLAVGQIAMASIANPDSLTSVGDNNLATTAQTAAPIVGAAGTGSMGQIEAGALESSTVNIATEFTNLLSFQRSYQADSRVITTSDELAQETIGLIHE